MVSYNLSYGTTTSLTVSGLATLANGSSATSSTVDNTTNLFIDVLLELTFTTGTVSATGTVELWAKGSIDNTDFDDDVNDRLIAAVGLTGTTAQTRKRVAGLAAAFGGTLPPYWQIRVRNATGAALTAGALSYRGATLQSA
jgi:hypothetical protein